MSELFVRNPGLLIPCLAIAGGVLIAVVAILNHTWRRHREAELEASLKQDMLNRGMSADDIVRVIRASAREEPSPPEPQDPVSDNEYYLVEKLVEEGKSAEEIERIIRAVKAGGDRPAVRPTDIVRASGN